MLNTLYFIVIASICIVATLPLIISPQKKAAIAFFIASVSLACWMFCLIMAEMFIDNALFWLRVDMIWSAIIPVAIVFFLFNYPIKRVTLRPWQIILILALPGMLIPITQTSWTTQMGVNRELIQGWGFYLFSLYFITYIGWAFYLIISGIKKLEGLNKIRMKYFAMGAFTTIVLASITNLLLPMIGISKFYKLGGLIPAIFIFVTTYSLLKYQWLDINLIISKWIALLLSFVFTTAIYLIIMWLIKTYYYGIFKIAWIPIAIVYWLVVALCFQNLRILLQSTATHVFLKGRYDFKKVIIALSDDLRTSGTIFDLIKTLNRYFQDEIEMMPITVFFTEGIEESQESSNLVYYNTTNAEPQQMIAPQLSIYFTDTREILMQQDAPSTLKPMLSQYKAHAAIPCLLNDKLIGVILIGSKFSQDPYNADDLDLFRTLSTQVPMAIERIQKIRLSAEMDIARVMQMEILPKSPQIPQLELVCFMKAAEAVGGDYYDVFQTPNGHWLIVGDVTGHGVGSGLVMFMVQSIIRSTLDLRPEITPKELNFSVNRILTQALSRLAEQRPMSIVVLKTENGRDFAFSGNHDHFYVYRAKTKEVEIVLVDQIPFGMGLTDSIPEAEYQESQLHLGKDDILILITDGIIEAPKDGDYNNELFGDERVIACIKNNADAPLEQLRQQLIDEVLSFTKGKHPDDITIILARGN